MSRIPKLVLVAAISTLFFSCSKSQFNVADSNSIVGSKAESDPAVVHETPEEVPKSETEISTPPVIADVIQVSKASGYATGVPSAVPFEWETYALRGTHIQIHYSVTENEAYSVGFQIFPKGENTETAQLDGNLLAQGEDSRPYAYAQYFNLEKGLGLHLFNLPLKFKANANSAEQFLKRGEYQLFITACASLKRESCTKSNAIYFELR